ncbi:hypothetical protein RF11_02300 [Thelohanellus kitauei]|uniref:Uncharacterized protein n=1 Tax=Thelohanellus kitauei TaxID=669202 RepID=A0A0C2MRV1_THEKT|nr:hypothetical protein RF11_02300 [Thelohanellus kitauei]
MASTAIYISLYLVSNGFMKLVRASDVTSVFLNLEVGQNVSHPSAFNTKPDLSSYARSSKHVATRTQTSAVASAATAGLQTSLFQVTTAKITSDSDVCMIVCYYFRTFPIIVDGDDILPSSLAKMVVHLDFLELSAEDVPSIMKTCNDLATGKPRDQWCVTQNSGTRVSTHGQTVQTRSNGDFKQQIRATGSPSEVKPEPIPDDTPGWEKFLISIILLIAGMTIGLVVGVCFWRKK